MTEHATSFVDRLAQGHLSTRPALALSLLLLLLGLAGAIAPEITGQT